MMQPYKTCKLFGAIRVILGIKDAIMLVHSPRGCVYNVRYLLGLRGAKTNRILTTEMDERDVIFGGEAKLRKAILDVDKRYNPNLIAVLTSCASSVIGEDIDLVAREIQRDVKAKILPIHSGGFEGDQIDGYKEAMNAVVNLIRDSEMRDENSVNLLAVYRYGWDVEEIKRILSMMQIEINSILTAKTTLKEIESASRARLNVVMCEASGFDAARAIKDRFGIPFIHPLLPIGIDATQSFISQISEFMDREIPEKILKEKNVAENEIEKIRGKIRGKRACIISGASRIPPLTMFVSELGIEPAIVSIDRVGETTLNDLRDVIEERNLNPKILIEPEFDEIIDAISQEKPDIIIGGLYEESLSRKFEIPLCDVMHGEVVTMCFKGAVNLANKIAEAIVSGK